MRRRDPARLASTRSEINIIRTKGKKCNDHALTQSMCICLCVGNAHYQRADRQLVGTLKLIAMAIMIYLSLKQTGYQVTAVQSADVPESMLRLNFGLALIKRHKVCAVEGFVVRNFHLKLPELRAREIDRSPIRRNLTSTCAADANCMHVYALAR
jgi:hypothetical protein